MALIKDRIDHEVEDIIRKTVREFMEPFALREVTTRAGKDHDGDPSIFIKVKHDLSEKPIDSRATAKLSVELWKRLVKLGEDRFPYIHHDFHENQKILGEE